MAERPLSPAETIAALERLQKQQAESAAARELEFASIATLLAPWLREPMRKADGSLYSRAEEIETKKQRLRERLPAMKKQSEESLAEGLASARRLGFPAELTIGGRSARVVGTHGSQPKYHAELNLPEVRTISAHRLWPSSVGGTGTGSTGLNLTGAAVRLGIWEVNDVVPGHTEFYPNRLTAIEEYGYSTEHGNGVAATMIGRGASADARGAAFAADAHARNSVGDIGELVGVLTGPSSERFLASNHSYAGFYGWDKTTHLGGSSITTYDKDSGYGILYGFPAGEYPIWHGDLRPLVLMLSDTVSYAFTDAAVEDYRFGLYSKDESEAADRVIYEGGTLLPVWAAGNDRGDATDDWHLETHFINGAPTTVWTNLVRQKDGGLTGYDSMTPEASAKNVLAVGAVNDQPDGFVSSGAVQVESYSNFGPTDDWRIKPDVVASGQLVYSATNAAGGYKTFTPGGTSFAAPAVTGAIGLLIERLRQLHGPDHEPPAAFLKGLIIHTADDVFTAGPDFQTGWGLVNADKAVAMLDPLEGSQQGPHARMVMIENGEAPLQIPVKAAGGQPLKVTIVWSDPSARAKNPDDEPTPWGDVPFIDEDRGLPAAGEEGILINDVDMSLTRGTTKWYPWVFTPIDVEAAGATPLPASDRTINGVVVDASGTPVSPPRSPRLNFRDNVEQIIVPSSQLSAGDFFTITLQPNGPMEGEWHLDDNEIVRDLVPQPVALFISGAQREPVPPFQIISFSQNGTARVIAWASRIGTAYDIQRSPSLAEGSWTLVPGMGSILSDGSLTSATFTHAGAGGHYYYRIAEVQ